MSIEDVNQSLEALHAEIDRLETTDAAVKSKLLALISDVEKQLQNPQSSDHKNANLQTLPTLIEQFEENQSRAWIQHLNLM